ncbi:hypothetical protein CMV_022639 [Castanea mollissima]|uniref:Glycosyl hydrolase family 32 C-terminal domain-containing protein n=1 Tax=Castanea mollissima TaxID=60419 RepID=A0A8J4QI29_9ROSI|nr:hypothetical protein CMV_022639 [Castanea mollissima]
MNSNQRYVGEDSSDSWDNDVEATLPDQMGAGAVNSDYTIEELLSLTKSSSSGDEGVKTSGGVAINEPNPSRVPPTKQAGSSATTTKQATSMHPLIVQYPIQTGTHMKIQRRERSVPSLDPNQVDPQQLCSQKGASTNNGTVGPFGLLALASKDLTEQTAVYFRIFKRDGKYVVLMCSDQSRSSLREGLEKPIYGAFVNMDPNDRKISLRSLIDHSVIENFGGEGRTCITARVYPKLAIDKEAHLYAFNNGTLNVRISKLNAWSMKRAQLVPYQKEMK